MSEPRPVSVYLLHGTAICTEFTCDNITLSYCGNIVDRGENKARQCLDYCEATLSTVSL